MSLDPQVQSSLITGISSLIVGLFGGNWIGKRHSTAQSTERCDKICSLMVNSFDKLLTALDIVGEPPEMKHAIREARDSIVTAKNYLGSYGSEVKVPVE
jgi:hypothetical protein